MKKKIILGIETSCDDTSIAILEENFKDHSTLDLPKVRAHCSFNQEHLLRQWGGVVPEIAARNHLQKIVPLLRDALSMANVGLEEIDLIGVTTLPGLLGPLLTGINTAKTLSLLLKIPIVPVNHLFAHLEAIFLTDNITPPYPYLGLLVSGGHSIFFWVTSHTDFHILGQTIDDAAGEAFDKGGRIMGLPYPAGQLIDKLSHSGNHERFSFPIGLKDEKSCNLSYSGVKTSLKNFIEHHPLDTLNEQDLSDLCASYQHAIVLALARKLEYAILAVNDKFPNQGTSSSFPIVVGGGVAGNSALRKVLQERFASRHPLHFVAPKYCTDNGAMIANYALRSASLLSPLSPRSVIPFPECLELDAAGKYWETK